MLKSFLVGTTVMMIAGTSLVLAQQSPQQRPQYRQDDARRWQPSADDHRAFEEARLAGLRAGLMLSPEQDKNWPAFEQATREFQAQRIAGIAANGPRRRSEFHRSEPYVDGNPAERMTQMADALRVRSAALTKVAEATAPLYGSLDEAQKRRFGILTQASHLAPFARSRMDMAMPRDRRDNRGDGNDRFFRHRSETDGRDNSGARSPARNRPTAPEHEGNL
jgi:zinc resistance-associated protein